MEQSKKIFILGNILALGSTILWAGNFIAAKVLASNYNGLEMSFWRWLLASIAVTPFALPYIKKDFPLIKQEWKLLTLYGVLGCFISNFLFYNAPQTAPAVDMTILMASSPLFMMILSKIIFKDTINIMWVFGSILCFLGVFILVTKGDLDIFHNLEFTEGHFWTLGCAICFALYSVSMRFFKVKIHITMFLFVTFVIALICSAILSLLYLGNFPPITNTEHIWAFLYIGVLASLFAFICWNLAIEYIGAVRAGIIYYLVPVFGSSFAVMFLHEAISIVQILGGLCVLGGVILCTVFKAK